MKQCPKCAENIQLGATKCRYCQSDLTPKGISQRILGWRDYITLPTAVLALVAALYTPIAETVRGLLGWDRASVIAFLLNPDAKHFPEIAAGASVGLFGRLGEAQLYKISDRPIAGPRKCSFIYYDKYGPKVFERDINPAQENMLLSLPR